MSTINTLTEGCLCWLFAGVIMSTINTLTEGWLC